MRIPIVLRHTLLLASVVMIPRLVAAQAVVSGIVIDSAGGQPIAGARIQVDGANRRAVSGEDGRFRLPGLPAGPLAVRVMMLGYRPVVRSVQAGATDVRIALERSAVGLEGVLITAVGSQRIREVGSDIAR